MDYTRSTVLLAFILMLNAEHSTLAEAAIGSGQKHRELKFDRGSCRPNVAPHIWEQLSLASLVYCEGRDWVNDWKRIWTKLRH
jgi:hypothetical protein